MAEDNSWTEWNRHILKELERLNAGQERASERLSELKTDLDEKLNAFMSSVRNDLIGIQQKISTYEPGKIPQIEKELESVKESIDDQETRLRVLEHSQSNFSGKWTIIGGVGAMILAAIISMIFSWVKSTPPPLPSHVETRPVSTAPASNP